METPVHPEARRGLPRWTLLALVPVAVLAACAIYLDLDWNRIPARFPVHWGAHGPNRWLTKTPLHVYAPLIFALGLAALLLAVGIAGYYGSRRSRAAETMLRVLIGVSWILGFVFAGVGLLPVGFPGIVVVAIAIPLGIALVLFLAQANAAPETEPDTTPDDAWEVGHSVYDNPNDKALFVPKRTGWGYTFNFANRWSWALLTGMVGGIGGLVVFLIWAQR